jgi:hypothetical protein
MLIVTVLIDCDTLDSFVLSNLCQQFDSKVTRNAHSSLNSWSCINTLDPAFDSRELSKTDAKETSPLHPTEAGNVCYAILVVSEIVLALQSDFQNAI